MMENIFDQFDKPKEKNIFDQFDTKKSTNIFDQFDKTTSIPFASPTEQSFTDPEAALFTGAQAQQQAEEQARKASEISIKRAAETPEIFQRAVNYMKVSGKEPQQEGESNEDFIKRFMSQRTFAETSTTFGAVPELNRLLNATAPEKKAVAEGIDLYKKLESRGGIAPVLDVAKGIASDLPLYAISGGVGAVAGRQAVKMGGEELLKRGVLKLLPTEATERLGARAGVGVMEAGLGAATDIQQQKIEQETKRVFGEEVPELNYVQTGVVALFSGAVGGLGTADIQQFRKVRQQGEALAEALKSKQPVTPPAGSTAPPTKVEKALADPLVDQMDKVHDEFMKNYGRDLLDTIDPANVLTDAKVKTELSKAAVRIAVNVIKEDPTFVLKANQPISQAINNVFKNLDKIDEAALERALNTAGVTKEEFAAMNVTTVSDAARAMQPYSAAARVLNRLQKTNSDFDQRIKELYSFENESVGMLSKFNAGQQRVAREWKALITSGVDTTARNVLSIGLVMPMKSAVQFMEGTAYSIGKALSNASSGQRFETLKKSMADTVKDSFDVYFYLFDPRRSGLSSDVANEILKHNPKMRDNINSALQETGNKDVLALTRWANSFNVAVDGVVRRAIFSDSVERQLRRRGEDMYDLIAKGKSIPAEIVTQATKESLQTTFSYLARKKDKSIASDTERIFSTAATETVNFINRTPILNIAIPFPRYMANAMAYLYRYSPVGSVTAGGDLLTARKLAQEGKEEQASMVYRQGVEKMFQAGIGTAALAAAYFYRKENPDKPWYEAPTNQGTTVDLRPLGTPASYFAISEVIARLESGKYEFRNIQDAFESVTGMKFKAGSGDSIIDRFIRVFESDIEAKKFFVEMGKFGGDFVKGFTQPFIVKQFVDLFNTIREGGTIVRDPNLIESEGTAAATAEAAAKRIMSNLPIAKEQLPEAVVRLSEGDVKREGEYFNRLLGFRQTIQRNPVETEIIKQNLTPYKLYGTSSGVVEYDRDFIREANKRVLQDVSVVINSNEYKKTRDNEKGLKLENAVQKAVADARKLVNEKYSVEQLETVYKMRYTKLSKKIRRAINTAYEEDNGVSLEEAAMENPKKWFDLDKYEAELYARIDETKSQTDRLLRR